jgi:hypothetical protein
MARLPPSIRGQFLGNGGVSSLYPLARWSQTIRSGETRIAASDQIALDRRQRQAVHQVMFPLRCIASRIAEHIRRCLPDTQCSLSVIAHLFRRIDHGMIGRLGKGA